MSTAVEAIIAGAARDITERTAPSREEKALTNPVAVHLAVATTFAVTAGTCPTRLANTGI